MNCLLDDLAEKAGCEYLSDLHTPELCHTLYAAITAIPSESYPSIQWHHALRYITQNTAVPHNSASILRQQLMNYLSCLADSNTSPHIHP